jgi:SAM-dependent methyltransferase
MSSPSAPLLALDAPEKVARIREVLDHVGFSEAGILSTLDVPRWPTARQWRQSRPLYLYRTRDGGPLHTLMRLFLLREPVGLEALRRAVSPVEPEAWQEVGLLRLCGSEATAAVPLCCFGGLVAAADWPERAPDHWEVMDVGSTSRFLAQATIRRPAARALDLGTGCGVQAFLAAEHSEQVVAVDANPRAVNRASFNARLNGRGRVACLEGNLFEPVRDQAFDLIVCNPPFVIGPGSDHLHTDSGLPLDAMCRAIARGAPPLLRPGGYCQLLGNWAYLRGVGLPERLGDWFEGSGCDVLVLHAEPQDAADYAAERIAEREEDPGRAARRFDEWMAWFEREQVEAVGSGLITLRRSARGASRIGFERLPEVRGPFGESIARAFERHDFLEEHRGDESLLDARLRPAPELRWEQELALSPEGWSVEQSRLRLAEGLAVVGHAGLDVVEFVSGCGSGRPLRELVGAPPAGTGGKVDPAVAARLRVVRRLVEVGYLEPDRAPDAKEKRE